MLQIVGGIMVIGALIMMAYNHFGKKGLNSEKPMAKPNIVNKLEEVADYLNEKEAEKQQIDEVLSVVRDRFETMFGKESNE